MAKGKKSSKKLKRKTPVKKVKMKKVKKKTAKKIKTKRKTKRVSAIPKGYNHVTPYLIVSNAASAIEFYKKVFGAKEVMRMSQSDGEVSHAELKIGDSKIMLADERPEMQVRSPFAYGGTSVIIHLYVKDVDDVVERALSAGARLARPVENMFYGDRSGSLQDPYGHVWFVSTHIEDVSIAEVRKRAAKLFCTE